MTEAEEILTAMESAMPADVQAFIERNRATLLTMIERKLAPEPAPEPAHEPTLAEGVASFAWDTRGKWVKGTYPVIVGGREPQIKLVEGAYCDGITLHHPVSTVGKADKGWTVGHGRLGGVIAHVDNHDRAKFLADFIRAEVPGLLQQTDKREASKYITTRVWIAKNLAANQSGKITVADVDRAVAEEEQRKRAEAHAEMVKQRKAELRDLQEVEAEAVARGKRIDEAMAAESELQRLTTELQEDLSPEEIWKGHLDALLTVHGKHDDYRSIHWYVYECNAVLPGEAPEVGYMDVVYHINDRYSTTDQYGLKHYTGPALIGRPQEGAYSPATYKPKSHLAEDEFVLYRPEESARQYVTKRDFLADVVKVKAWADDPDSIIDELLGWSEGWLYHYLAILRYIPHHDERALARAFETVLAWVRKDRPGKEPYGYSDGDFFQGLSEDLPEGLSAGDEYDDYLGPADSTLSHIEYWPKDGYRYQGYYFVKGPFDQQHASINVIKPVFVHGAVSDLPEKDGKVTRKGLALIEDDIERYLVEYRSEWQPEWWQKKLELYGTATPEKEQQWLRERQETRTREIMPALPPGTQASRGDFWTAGLWAGQFAAIWRNPHIDAVTCSREYMVQPLHAPVEHDFRGEVVEYLPDYLGASIGTENDRSTRWEVRSYYNKDRNKIVPMARFDQRGQRFTVYVREDPLEVQGNSDTYNDLKDLRDHLDLLGYEDVTYERARINDKDVVIPVVAWRLVMDSKISWGKQTGYGEAWDSIYAAIEKSGKGGVDYAEGVATWFYHRVEGNRTHRPVGIYALINEKLSSKQSYARNFKFILPIPKGWKP